MSVTAALSGGEASRGQVRGRLQLSAASGWAVVSSCFEGPWGSEVASSLIWPGGGSGAERTVWSHKMILIRPWKVARRRTGLALWTFSSAVKQKAEVEREASLGFLAACPGLLPSSQHPLINGIPRLGMPLNALPPPPCPTDLLA